VAANWNSTSTPSTLASALASGLGSCATNGNGMVGVASGSTVYLGACNTSATYTTSVGVVGCSCSSSNPPDFSAVVTTEPPSGQLPPVPGAVYDSGTVTLTVNGTQIATASYGANSTPESIASALASAGSGNSLVTLSVSGDSLSMTAKGDGTVTDYSYQVTPSSTNPATFTSPSFTGSPSSASLTGGTNVPLYNWAINSYAPNGDVLSMTDFVMGTWSYTYDDMNRLTKGTASTCAGCVDAGLNLSWTYDRYGNRWAQTATTAPGYNPPDVTVVQPQLTLFGSNGVNTNRIDGPGPGCQPSQAFCYDAAGNLLNDAINQYTYDAENRIATLNGSPAYIYDAEGKRVAKLGSGGTVTASYVLGLDGEQVSEVNGAGVWVHSNVFAGGRLLASYEGPAGTDTAGYHFHLTDWLGTKRMQTTASGNQEEVCYSYPFGDGLNCTGGADATEHHFTGKERDTESGNDYFGARYYASSMGRFMSPDWSAKVEPVPYAKLDNPQTLNLYAYMRNNPLGGTDPDGHCDWCQKLWNYANKKGWKTDEQVAQKGVNNNTVLVQTSSIPGNTDTKEPDNKDVRHVTYTPTKIENGVLKGPVSTNPADPNVKVTLWESNPNVDNGSYANQGTTNGSGKDRILTGAGILSPSVDQHWSVNGERVQVMVGKNADGTVQTTWQLHVDRSGDVPKFTPVATPAPE